MNKRTFIKVSSILMASPFLSPLEGWSQKKRLQNWSGNLTYSTNKVFYPNTVAEVQDLVIKHKKIKALGTRHCFNNIADSKYALLSTRDLNKIISLDENAKTVTIEGGMKYGELCPYIDVHGLALHNLASLPHISVAGAITTATHGSGITNGNLATAVTALEFVNANGDLVYLSKDKDGEKFNASVVGLGAIGIITKVSLALQPTYQMRQYVYENLPLQQMKDHFEEIVSAGYSVSLFTDWQKDSINEVWIKSRMDHPSDAGPMQEFFGATAATKNLHPIAALSAENCTEQMGIPGPWYDRLPHFKMGFTPSSGKELQTEYFVPRNNAVEAILAVQSMGKDISPHLFISEIRTIYADNLWLSPCYKQPCVTIHFTWKQEWDAVSKLLPMIEKQLAPYKAIPHWGKLFTMPASTLASLHPRTDDFKKLVAEYDPKGKFTNEFLEKNIYGIG